MGRPSTNATEIDQAEALAAGTIAAAGPQPATGGVILRGDFNLLLSGTFVATIVVERSFDGGTNWFPMNLPSGGAAISFTAPINTVIESGPEIGVLYRLNCTALTSGSAAYRLSQ